MGSQNQKNVAIAILVLLATIVLVIVTTMQMIGPIDGLSISQTQGGAFALAAYSLLCLVFALLASLAKKIGGLRIPQTGARIFLLTFLISVACIILLGIKSGTFIK